MKRDWPWFAFTLGVIILSALSLAGCGTSLKAAYGSLVSVERLVNTAAIELPGFDEKRQLSIAAAAPTLEAGKAQLDAWRKKREEITKAIEGANASVRLARDGIHDVEAGLAKPKTLDTWIGPALRAATNLITLLHAVGINLGIPFAGSVI